MAEFTPSHGRGAMVTALLLGAGVPVALGVYGRLHTPGYGELPSLGFSSAAAFKSWLATLVFGLALVQLGTALWIFGRLPGARAVTPWLPALHRVSGYVAFAFSLPVAAYCLYGFGFARSPFTPRTLLHSVAGCLFYGAFAPKVVVVHARRAPCMGGATCRRAATHADGRRVVVQRTLGVLHFRVAPVGPPPYASGATSAPVRGAETANTDVERTRRPRFPRS